MSSLLTDGRDAAASGDFEAAVRLLTEACRSEPDLEAMRQLVTMRYEAAAALTDRSRLNPIPAKHDRPVDPFPGETGLPEITPERLDADTIAGGILHHGVVAVRGLLDPDQAQQLREHVEHALAAVAEHTDGRRHEEFAAWYDPTPCASEPAQQIQRGWVRKCNGVLTMDSPPALFHLMEHLHRTGAVGAIAELLGEQPVLAFEKTTLRRTLQTNPTWHQDGSFMGEQVRAANVWLSLSHCGGGTDTIGIDIIPRRFDHLLPTDTEGAVFANSIGPGVIEREAAGAPILTPTFYPGDALFFDARFVHRTSTAPGNVNYRYAMENWFFAPSTFPEQYTPFLA